MFWLSLNHVFSPPRVLPVLYHHDLILLIPTINITLCEIEGVRTEPMTSRDPKGRDRDKFVVIVSITTAVPY